MIFDKYLSIFVLSSLKQLCMEIKITTKQILKVLLVLSWIIFIGVCIEAGGLIFNTFYALVLNPIAARSFWMKADLSGLLQYDRGNFFAQTFFMIIVAVLKAIMFYLIVKTLHDKKLNMAQPFSKELTRFVSITSYLALLIGLFSLWGVKYAGWLTRQGVSMPGAEQLRLGGADVWLFMGVTLLVITQIFKRGIEIQTENELTV